MTRPMHMELAKTLGAFVAAGFSLFGATLADSMPNDTKGWFEGGAYLAFVSFLLYAVKHLNAEVRRQQDLREADRLKMENQYAKQHDENLASRNKMAEALVSLSSAVNELKK